jgi:hypothetical protein
MFSWIGYYFSCRRLVKSDRCKRTRVRERSPSIIISFAHTYIFLVYRRARTLSVLRSMCIDMSSAKTNRRWRTISFLNNIIRQKQLVSQSFPSHWSKHLLIVSGRLIRPFRRLLTASRRMTLLWKTKTLHLLQVIAFDVCTTNDVDYRARRRQTSKERKDRSFDRSRAVVELISLHIHSSSLSMKSRFQRLSSICYFSCMFSFIYLSYNWPLSSSSSSSSSSSRVIKTLFQSTTNDDVLCSMWSCNTSVSLMRKM